MKACSVYIYEGITCIFYLYVCILSIMVYGICPLITLFVVIAAQPCDFPEFTASLDVKTFYTELAKMANRSKTIINIA